MKISCSKCGISGEASLFRKDSGRAKGVRNQCRRCHQAYRRAWKNRNPEKVRQYSLKHKGTTEEIIELSKQKHKLNKARRAMLKMLKRRVRLFSIDHSRTEKKCSCCHAIQPIDMFRLRRDRNTLGARSSQCEDCWAAINKVRCRERRGVDRPAILELFGHQCAGCGSTDKVTLDHHVPFAMGGELVATNTVLLCRECNLKKSAKHPREFYSDESLTRIEYLLR